MANDDLQRCWVLVRVREGQLTKAQVGFSGRDGDVNGGVSWVLRAGW